MAERRPTTVTLAFALVVLQILISLAAAVIAALAPADYKTYAATTPGILIVLYAVVAYFLWAGSRWARTLTLVIAALGAIGNLSVILYYDHTATVTMNIVGLVIAVAIIALLLAPASKAYVASAR